MNTKDLIIPKKKIHKLLVKCATLGNISVAEMMIESRERTILLPRQKAMYFLKHFTKMSNAKIGKLLGGKDHATVIHSCKTIRNQMETDKNLKNDMEEIERFVIKLCETKPPEVKKPEPKKIVPVIHDAIPIEQNIDFKSIAEERMNKIVSMQYKIDELNRIIADLRQDVKISDGQVRFFKKKLEYANMPRRILCGE